jgi:hypothetical protein
MIRNMQTNLACFGVLGVLAFYLTAYGAESISKKWPQPQKGILVFAPPEDAVVPTNGIACFTVVAQDDQKKAAPLYFQWQKNETIIPGATQASLILSNVQIADVGFYSCLVYRGNTNAKPIVVRGIEPDAPGARLFVYSGTNTVVSGPYQPGTGNKSCIGSYLGRVTFKVPGTQSTWFSRPAGTTQCTITDTSGYSTPYSAKVEAVESYSLWSTCKVQTVTFPTKAPPTYKYQFTTYVTSGAPPSGSTLTLDIQWLP